MTPTAPAPANFQPAPADPSATPPPPKPAAWPEWLAPFDIALGILAVSLAFLMGSFVSRTADLWRHLAAGRLVAQGQYPFGGDPFSYTATSGVWVNPAWLGELVLYTLYTADPAGGVVVAAKAALFAAAVGLLFLLRKPGFPLWPWAVAAAVGAVAAGAHTHLRPPVFGFVLFAGLLAVLYRGNWTSGNGWRMPAVVGGLTALWANVDAFAFLSPLLVGLILLGEWLHPKVFSTRADLPPDADPFRPAPPRAALLRTLPLCAVAVLLNPTFLAAVTKDPGEAVAQLVPFELDWQAAKDLEADEDLGRLSQSALNSAYLSNPGFGLNPSGVFALVLMGAGAVLAGVGYRNGRLSHLLVWLACTLLAAVVHARFVPYAVLVGVPFVAAHLNGLGRLFPPLHAAPERIARGLLSLVRLGRVLSLAGVVVLLVLAVPGRLHPRSSTSPALNRSVAWGVEEDEGMRRAGEVFAAWHADPTRGPLLRETRGLNAHPDLGDFLAWRAPAEKSFVSSRFRLHRGQLADLAELRQKLRLNVRREKPAEQPRGELRPLSDKYAAGYLVLGQRYAAVPAESLVVAANGLIDPKRTGPPPALGDFLWHADGRVVVVGRADTPDAERRSELMRWEPARLVFGPTAEPGPAGDLSVGAAPLDDLSSDVFLVRPPVTPAAVSDYHWYTWYGVLLQQDAEGRAAARTAQLVNVWRAHGNSAGWGNAQMVFGLLQPDLLLSSFAAALAEPLPDAGFALPLLAARSARTAHARTPDAYDPFLLLYQITADPLVPDADPPRDVFPVYPPEAPTERQLHAVTALTRALARLPAANTDQGRYAAAGLQVRAFLLEQYLRVGQAGYVGPAEKVAKEMKELAAASPADLTKSVLPLLPVWDRIYRLADAEFNFELERFAAGNNGRLSPAWERLLQTPGGRFQLLVERGYLAPEDDPAKWRKKYSDAVLAGESPPAEAVRERIDRAAEVLGHLAARRNDRARPEAARLTPEQQFFNLVRAGLPDRALDLIPKKGEPDKVGAKVNAAEVLRVMLWTGLAEVVALQMDEQTGALAEADAISAEQAALARGKLKLVEFDLARLAGDYARAGRLLDEVLAAPPAAPLDPRSADALVYADLWRPAIFSAPTAAEAAALKGGGPRLVLGGDLPGTLLGGAITGPAGDLDRLRARLLYESFTHYQKGVYALYAGEPARAKEHFDAAAEPHGVPVAAVGLPPSLQEPLGRMLPKYRDLLTKYAK